MSRPVNRDARRRRTWTRASALSAAFVVVTLVATVVMALELGPVTLRIGLFCALVAASVTTLLLRRTEERAARRVVREHEARRRWAATVESSVSDLRARVDDLDQRVQTQGGRGVEIGALRSELGSLLAEIETLATRQQHIEGAVSAVRAEHAHALVRIREDLAGDLGGLREDVAHELETHKGRHGRRRGDGRRRAAEDPPRSPTAREPASADQDAESTRLDLGALERQAEDRPRRS